MKTWSLNGLESIEDEPRSGRPRKATTHAKVQAVDRLVRTGRRMKVADISESLAISIGTVTSIMHDDLGYSKVSCRWVPKMLTNENKTRQVEP